MQKPKHTNRHLQRLFAITLALGTAFSPSFDSGAAEPPPEAPPVKKWDTVATVGFTLSSGNSKNYLLSALINSTRKWAKDELLMGGSGGYGENTTKPAGQPETTSKTDDYLKGYIQWNHLFTERFYGGLRLDGIHDDIADIDYRFTLSPLAGYYFIKATNTFLAGEIGPAFVTQKQGGVRDDYVGIRFAQRWEYKFKSGARMWDTVDWTPQVDEFDNWVMNAEAGVSAPLNKSLEVRLILQDTYDNQPAPGRLKNDLKLIAGLGYRF